MTKERPKERPNKWDKNTAVSAINRNGGRIKGDVIHFPNAGIKMQSAIDYLVNYCKMRRG